MKDRKIRIKPYLPIDDVTLLEEVSKATGLSLGAVLLHMLYDSKTFIACKESFDNDEERLKEVFYRPDVFASK